MYSIRVISFSLHVHLPSVSEATPVEVTVRGKSIVYVWGGGGLLQGLQAPSHKIFMVISEFVAEIVRLCFNFAQFGA